MKNYNIQNYIRYKKDIDTAFKNLKQCYDYRDYNKEELTILFMPLVENLARKFSTSQQASGVMSILDLIQEGNFGLVAAINRIDWDTIYESDDPEKRLKSFLSKRIKGAIRRGININRGGIRIPEHKLNEINRNFETDKKMVAMFFNSVFASLDDDAIKEHHINHEQPKEDKYKSPMFTNYILNLLKLNLNIKEYDVIRMSYGLDCEKHTAKEIANKLNITGSGSYVRVSNIKKQAIQKLIENVEHSQVIDFL
tara:strand:+ start:300 stop:1058 length:759 start_codon:yes stop_codon:yes gene_type:complete